MHMLSTKANNAFSVVIFSFYSNYKCPALSQRIFFSSQTNRLKTILDLKICLLNRIFCLDLDW